MNKFERLKEMSTLEAKKLIESLVGEEAAKKFFEEERKTISISEAEVGSFIVYGGLEWVVLDKTTKGVKVLSKHRLYNRAFDTDNHNNWAASTLRNELNNFNKCGWCCAYENTSQINKKDLVEFERDLTTDDGMTDYGKCRDYISLLTCEEYRKYRKLIPLADDWCWTITADSLVCDSYVRYVNSDGSLNSNYTYDGDNGVRPLCVLKSEIEVEVCDEKV